MAKIKDFLKKNKDDILLGWSLLASGLALVFFAFCAVFMVISDDLVKRVEAEVQAQEDLKIEIEIANMRANYYYYLADDLQQSYEDVVPKQQYIDDVEYLESVIRELRGQE